jgi:NUMOD4 motif
MIETHLPEHVYVQGDLLDMSAREDEIWLPISGFEGTHEVSSLRRVRSLPRRGTSGRILSHDINPLTGNAAVTLVVPGRREHRNLDRLMAETFSGATRLASWTTKSDGREICLSCLWHTTGKPRGNCAEPRHQDRYDQNRLENAARRKRLRLEARALGMVYRNDWGNPSTRVANGRRRHIQLRDSVFRRLGQSSCVRCGFKDRRALQLDHINGGGRRHRRSMPSGSAYYRSLKDMPDDELRATFQVLCANCNAIKREEQREWEWDHPQAPPSYAPNGRTGNVTATES